MKSQEHHISEDEKDIRIAQLERALVIESTVEQIRAASMAMHKSEELPTVALTFLNQIEQLGIPVLGTSINLVNGEKATYQIYFANGQNIGVTDKLHTDDFWLAKESFRLLKNGETEFTLECEGAKLKTWVDWLKKEVHLGRGQKLEKANLEKAFVHTVQFYELSHLIFSSIHPLSEETMNVMRKMTKAFGQSYVRFLDLQKAEAQTREAQIEIALERIRSRALVMRHSDELSEAAELLYQEFFKLGVDSFSCGYLINDDENGVWKIWLTNPGEKFFKEFWTAPMEGDAVLKERYESWKSEDEFHCAVLEGEMNKKHHEYITTLAPWKEVVNTNLPPRLVFNSAHFSVGHLLVISPDKLSKEIERAMVRFANVFDLTYQRFLDLQKAEEQAREVQIEVALERVRASTMAMHHSSDLTISAGVLFEQIKLLGAKVFSSGFVLCEENNPIDEQWMYVGGIENIIQQYLPHEEEPFHFNMYKAWKAGKALLTQVIEGETLLGIVNFLMAQPSVKNNLEKIVGSDTIIPTLQILHSAHFSKGYLLIITTEEFPEKDVFIRFAKVFDQTYTRFLDLQKAEAQAKKAEIQASKIELANLENERLLHSILPRTIAEQIKSDHRNVVKRFEEVSILFADLVGFTVLSENLTPQEVVDLLNGLFSKFDDLTDKYGIEKIKTIGDAYMVAAGVPEEKKDHAQVLFQFAKEMLQTLQDYNHMNQQQLKLRVGISSGPVVAGVIGKKKFAYDLWGDTVNIAARMEAYGQEDRIQISPVTYEILKNDYAFEKISNVEIKGKGKMDVYLWKEE